MSVEADVQVAGFRVARQGAQPANAGGGRGPRVLLVEDDPDTQVLVLEVLRRAGIMGVAVGTAEAALAVVAANKPDLVLLDLGLPGSDGSTLVGDLRDSVNLPVIIMTGRSRTDDVVRGLELGADDYLIKPVPPRELIARIRAVLRATLHPSKDDIEDVEDVREVQRDGCVLRVDISSRSVVVGDRRVALTPKELDLLAFFLARPNRVHSRDRILGNVWHTTPRTCSPSTVNEHVRRVRNKIEDDPSRPRWILTVPGFGYRFQP